ncbi:tubulin-like doman-containing protein [Actinomycetospora sp. CA-084318]|uniref:tubulin-like doman-containing protein n=1 Tax=Actinomycetospora sp. CA-084318 TaxID=3239892 RepID=UPI003D96EC95
MRRFLVVGCGGSGGATLAYLMDQLRSDLGARGVAALPTAWQFVHIDVPHVCEAGPDGLGSVVEQGGTYVGCAPRADSYAVLDEALSQRFADARRFDAIATWAPREPARVNIPISVGAGQYRAIGRMISLNRARSLRDTLQSVWDRFGRPSTAGEMREVAEKVPGLGEFDDGPPLVLVVSSMAGGAGASMALDVCRLLTLVEGLDSNLLGAFLVAPNIFDGLPEASRTGVRPNALAMLGEIFASQAGAAREHDAATLEAMGLEGAQRIAVPFARVFPVGRFAGIDRTQFGDGSQRAVYRGLGRGLAGLLMSDKAVAPFVSFDLGNRGSPPGNRDLLGWGSNWDNLPWGSYGFASLSMGRDRYAEYSAQRIARSAVERLLHGHLQAASNASSNEQVATLLDSQREGVCRRAGLPPDAATIPTWLTGYAFNTRTVVEPAAVGIVGPVVRQIPPPEGLQAAQWVPALRQKLAEQAPRVTSEVERTARQLVFEWHQQQLLPYVEHEVSLAVAEIGLPYGVAVVEYLGQHAREVLAVGLDRIVADARPGVTAISPEVEQALGRLKGPIQGGAPIVEEIGRGLQANVRLAVHARVAELTAALLRQFTVDVLAPLSQALSQAQRLLETAMAADPVDVGLARLATAEPVAWPADDLPRVPSRFDEADNEVLLTSSADFQAQYESDLRRAVDRTDTDILPLFPDARRAVVKAVVSGVWRTTGGERPPGGLIERRAQWRSRVFPTDPGTGEAIIPSHTHYEVHVRPAELLDRARRLVSRPGESFDNFCRLSITDFIKGADGIDEAGLGRRQDWIVDKFIEALKLARPLISVNSTALQAVHRADIEYRYKFSEVPFHGQPVASRLVRVLENDRMVDRSSVTNLEQAISDAAGVTRIDVFGSYPNYSPLVFDAVLGPVAQQWAAVSDMGRDAFWEWRRSRPLHAALPMGDDERRTMVAGWLLGQIAGRIQIPAPPYRDAARVWDAENGRWEPFPHPLLTPPRNFVAAYDWLPAVLESILLAVARSHLEPVMASLRPYQLLRMMFDESPQRPAGGIEVTETSGRDLVRRWLIGDRVSGMQSVIEDLGESAGPEERAGAATEWLRDIRELAGEHYMAPGEQGAPGGGTFSVITFRRVASGTPLFRDIAADVYWAAETLMSIIDEEVKEIERRARLPRDPDGGTRPDGRGARPAQVSVPESKRGAF